MRMAENGLKEKAFSAVSSNRHLALIAFGFVVGMLGAAGGVPEKLPINDTLAQWSLGLLGVVFAVAGFLSWPSKRLSEVDADEYGIKITHPDPKNGSPERTDVSGNIVKP